MNKPNLPNKCPACLTTLTIRRDFSTCDDGCGGTWVSEAALEERVKAINEYAYGLVFTDWPETPGQLRRCPDCAAVMETKRIVESVVERCRARHGIWFDKDEFSAVLRKSAEERNLQADQEPMSALDYARLVAWAISMVVD